MEQLPLVSVIMPVYNCKAYVQGAVDSILNQTLRELELIVVDDGSTDGSWELLQGVRDPRIRLLRQQNSGAYAARNAGLAAARAPFVASMDADDISHPDRLRHQYEYLRTHSDVALVGSWFVRFDGNQEQEHRGPTGDYWIKYALFDQNPFAGGDVMFRTDILRIVGPYRAFYADDYDLWLRISEVACVAILPCVLYRYRVHKGQITQDPTLNLHRDGLRAVRYARQRCLFGVDSLGYATPGGTASVALLTTYQVFALHAFWSHDWNLAFRLLGASLCRSPVRTIVAAANPGPAVLLRRHMELVARAVVRRLLR